MQRNLALLILITTIAPAIPAEETPAPQAGPAEVIVRAIEDESLRLLAADVLDRNPELAVLAARARAAEQDAPRVRALPDPTLSATLFLFEPQTRVGPQQASATFAQKLPGKGKLDLREQAALFDAAAAWTRVEAERLRLVTRTRTLYLELQYLERERSIVETDATTLEHYEQLARARYASGVGIGQSVIKIQAEITRARTRLLDIDRDEVRLRASINALRDRPRDTPVIVGETAPSLDDLPPFEALRRTAVSLRPEVSESRTLIDAAATRVELADAASHPDFTVGLTYALVERRSDEAGRFNPPEGNGDDVLGLTGGMTLPIWSKALDAETEGAVQRRLATESALRSLTVEIDGRLADLSRRIPLIREQLALFEGTLSTQAEASLISAEEAYASGTLSALDLLDAERTLLRVRVGTERARTDLAVALAELEGVAAAPITAIDTEENEVSS